MATRPYTSVEAVFKKMYRRMVPAMFRRTNSFYDGILRAQEWKRLVGPFTVTGPPAECARQLRKKARGL